MASKLMEWVKAFLFWLVLMVSFPIMAAAIYIALRILYKVVIWAIS